MKEKVEKEVEKEVEKKLKIKKRKILKKKIYIKRIWKIIKKKNWKIRKHLESFKKVEKP